MSHPRIEEVSDSDDDISDPSEGDIDDFNDADILRRVDQPSSSSSSSAAPPGAKAHLINPSHIPSTTARTPAPQFQSTADTTQWNGCQALYPVYFDATRSRASGRRVSRALAVRNPLAREIVNACTALGLHPLFEQLKTHPKDWANPGRVKVDLRGSREVKNKHHLYVLVAKHLAKHPVTENSGILREALGGGGVGPPPPEMGKGEGYPRPAVPRGWKMGELLPYYSPAMTGGGVSENFLKDMMKEMQGGGDMASMLQAAGAGGAGGSGKDNGDGGGKKGKKGKGKA